MSKAILVILDGFGIGKNSPFNAIRNARKPFLNEILGKYPHSELLTHGSAVGLPEGVMGNSEVGHMTIGAGRVIYQDLTRINASIEATKNGQSEFSKNPSVQSWLNHKGGRLHAMGLLSDGGVHSHIEHLFALMKLCVQNKIPELALHLFFDGRDTPPQSGVKYLKLLQEKIKDFYQTQSTTQIRIVSLAGRYFAMDRDNRAERTEKAFQVITGNRPQKVLEGESADKVLERAYSSGVTDEFIEPTLIYSKWALKNDDALFYFNYRADRARQLSSKLFNEGYSLIGMTRYDAKVNIPYAFGPQNLNNIFSEWLEIHQKKQFRIAETEKYAHVTFFFNGGREKPFIGEERLLIDSPKDVPTYDLKPEMSAFKIAEAATKKIELCQFDFLLMNFANADMVGHTGNYEATVRAIETLDRCLLQVIGAAEKNGYHTIITADHGNAEEMIDCHGVIHTQHTLNPVPAIWIAPNTAISPRSEKKMLHNGSLVDIMPTLCQLMNLEIPSEVTGKSLLP